MPWAIGYRVLAAAVLATVVTASIGGATAAAAATTVPGAPGCPMFPADNVWNTSIASLPVNIHNSEWMASLSSTAFLHPDYGPSDDPSNPYGIPFTVVQGHPLANISFQYSDESDRGPYPFGPDTPIEGGPSATGDRHAIMVDSSTCTLYELYDATYSPSGSSAGSGAIWNLRSDALRPPGWTSADAAGLPILPGLVDYDEVASGSMDHAIRFTAQCTESAYIWPARHEAGQANSTCPPMGARFRLKANFSLPTSQCSPMCQTVVTAMQKYGLILADNGSNWYFQGTADTRWTGTEVDQLKRIPSSAFEAVDESSLMVGPDSGQAVQPANRPLPPVAVPTTSTTIGRPPPSSIPPTSTPSTSASSTTIAGHGWGEHQGGLSGSGGPAAAPLKRAAVTRIAGARGEGRAPGLDVYIWVVLSLGGLAVLMGVPFAAGAVRRRLRMKIATTGSAARDQQNSA